MSSNSDEADALSRKLRTLFILIIPTFRYREITNIVDLFESIMYSFPVIPEKYNVAVIVFRVLFETFNYAQDSWTAASPPSVSSAFMFIRELKGKLRFLKIILEKMCKSSCHCDALFAVFSENFRIFKQKSSRIENYWKYFFLKSMMMIRIFQHTNFPSGEDRAMVLLCPGFQQKVLEKMEQKSGFKDTRQRHLHLHRYLSTINQKSNDLHSSAIRRLIKADPNFFSTCYNILNGFFHRCYQLSKIETKMWRTIEKKLVSETLRITMYFESMYSKNAEEYWIRLMNQGCPDLLTEFRKHSIGDDTIRWIFYWYFHQTEFPSMSFNDIMNVLVQDGKMSFPSPQPPKIFSDNNGSRRQKFSLLGSPCPCVRVNSLLEICLIMDSPPDVPPAAKFLLESFRRKLALKEGNRIICKGLFEIFVHPTIHSFLFRFMLNHRHSYMLQKLEREYALKKQNLDLRRYLNRFTQKRLLQLKILPFWSFLIRRMLSNN